MGDDFSYPIHSLLDSGSTSTLLKYETFHKINRVTPLQLKDTKVKLKSITANDLTVHGLVTLTITFNDITFKIDTFVVDDSISFQCQMLIGQDFLSNNDITINFKKRLAHIHVDGT